MDGHVQAVEDVDVDNAQRAAAEKKSTILDEIKQNPKAIFYCVLMAVGPMMYGFDNIIVGVITAMPAFK